MKRNKINKYVKATVSVALLSMMTGCTGNFEELNTNPFGPTPEQMLGDNAETGSLIKTMIPTLAQGQQNNAQMLDVMIGSEYGGLISNIGAWGNNGNYETYNPRVGWYGNMFDTTMPQIYTSYFQIKQKTEGKGVAYNWAQLLRIAATLKISDCYGPVPYSKISGTAFTVPYDSMEDLYNALFADLDEVINSLKTVVLAGEDMSSLTDYDLVYSGNFTRWVKYANTLKLRMAMRLVNVNPTLAREKAEEAVSDVIGVMVEAGDAAMSSFNDGMNPYYRIGESWGEIRASANVTSYLKGYEDPRLSIYTQESSKYPENSFVGVRNGIMQSATSKAAYQEFSKLNIGMNDKLLIMSASEAYFLRAEAALRGYSVGGSAKDLYNKGVEISMTERNAAIGNYLSSSKTPADYVDPYNSGNSMKATTAIAPQYDEKASMEANLERIMIQKWIANFPNGWETWADIRRTGYPKLFPIVNNRNTDGVTTQRGMRRLPFPQSEYNTNTANVTAAAGMLGGADNSATDIWWAKKY